MFKDRFKLWGIFILICFIVHSVNIMVPAMCSNVKAVINEHQTKKIEKEEQIEVTQHLAVSDSETIENFEVESELETTTLLINSSTSLISDWISEAMVSILQIMFITMIAIWSINFLVVFIGKF